MLGHTLKRNETNIFFYINPRSWHNKSTFWSPIPCRSHGEAAIGFKVSTAAPETWNQHHSGMLGWGWYGFGASRCVYSTTFVLVWNPPQEPGKIYAQAGGYPKGQEDHGVSSRRWYKTQGQPLGSRGISWFRVAPPSKRRANPWIFFSKSSRRKRSVSSLVVDQKQWFHFLCVIWSI